MPLSARRSGKDSGVCQDLAQWPYLARQVSSQGSSWPQCQRELVIHLPFTSLYTSVINRLLLSGVSPFVVASYGAVKFAARTSSSDLP